MVLEENPATDGGGEDGGIGPPGDGPQIGQEDQGTGVPDETTMDVDQQVGPDTEIRVGARQDSPLGLSPLERRRQLDIVSVVARISLLAQAMGGLPASRSDPQAGPRERSHEQQTAQQEGGERQASRQASSERSAQQEGPDPRSDSQDFIPLSFA